MKDEDKKTRRCYVCKKTKCIDEFRKKRNKPLGRDYICKSCHAEQQLAYSWTTAGKAARRKYREGRGKAVKQRWRENNRIRCRGYVAKDRSTKGGQERHRRHNLLYQKQHPERHRAKCSVYNAIKRGRLYKPDHCSIKDETCKGRLEAHHEDYAKPLKIVWLCNYHHNLVTQAKSGKKA